MKDICGIGSTAGVGRSENTDSLPAKSKMFSSGIYYIIFAVSGFTGLIYETIWTRYLKLFLGHASYAQSLVLVIFMGGLAIGAWLAGRYGGKLARPLAAYALAEGIIGIFAIYFHPIYIGVTSLAFDTIIPSIGSGFTIHVIKWSMAAGLILPQSILLGATFPLMSSGLIRLYPARPGRLLALLYFANSIGASFGAIMTGFVLVLAYGLPGL